jgi:phospholipid/cholesterol/gamma-HCH transport system permease protein
MIRWLGKIGAKVLDALQTLGGMAALLWEVLTVTFSKRPRWRETFYQFNQAGAKSQVVVLITGAFTGMVFAVQTYFQFKKVQMETAVGPVVSVAMARELGPVLTALMVSGRVGAAMAAELGTMRVTEQIDALRAMATHPVDYLVVPRFVAVIFSMPLLTAEAIAIGIASGYMVGVGVMGIDQAYYIDNTLRWTEARDVWMGLIKALIFGGFIALISCYKGFYCKEGAEGVGQATTQAVVVSSITVLISNFFIALLLNILIPS